MKHESPTRDNHYTNREHRHGRGRVNLIRVAQNLIAMVVLIWVHWVIDYMTGNVTELSEVLVMGFFLVWVYRDGQE